MNGMRSVLDSSSGLLAWHCAALGMSHSSASLIGNSLPTKTGRRLNKLQFS